MFIITPIPPPVADSNIAVHELEQNRSQWMIMGEFRPIPVIQYSVNLSTEKIAVVVALGKSEVVSLTPRGSGRMPVYLWRNLQDHVCYIYTLITYNIDASALFS